MHKQNGDMLSILKALHYLVIIHELNKLKGGLVDMND